MIDPRRETLLGLMLEWDHTENRLHEHLGLTPEQWLDFRSSGELPPDYQPREPREAAPAMPETRGRPFGCHVSPEKRAKVRELLKEGLTRAEIANRVGISRGSISGIARRMREKEATP